MALIEVTDANFENEVTKSDKPVLIDVWATWCAPCRALTPILEKIADSDSMKDKILIKKLNADENPTTSASLGVRGLPTMLLFKNGQCVDTRVGLQSESVITDWIDQMVD